MRHGYTQDLTVDIGEGRSYPIRFVQDAKEVLAKLVTDQANSSGKLAVITDMNLQLAHPELFEQLLKEIPTFVVSPGEPSKSVQRLGELWDFLAQIQLDRQGKLVALGGGVIGDLAGFAAASFLRGVAYYQVPTSLLAMVDSSIGGKTGINISAGKNLVGAFYHPEEVLIDTRLLESLPATEFSAGMAEVVKYGLLGDLGLFQKLEDLDRLHPQHPELPSVIRRCCEIKAQVVRDDERETSSEGGRALLNLGHTFGHAIENVAGYGVYLHGEAVSIGMIAAAELSHRKGWISMDDCDRIRILLERYDLPVSLQEKLLAEDLLNSMKRDKKVRSGIIRFVAMRNLGDSFTTSDVDEILIRNCLTSIGAV